MRYAASGTLEIIQLVERLNLSVHRMFAQLSFHTSIFHGWYRRCVEGGLDALEDRLPKPTRVWIKMPEETRGRRASSWR